MPPHHRFVVVSELGRLAEMPNLDSATVLPNFFIVGAPKAGTTSLYHYLDQHPEIYMSPIKETNYFASEVRPQILGGNLQEQIRRDEIALQDYLRGTMLEKRFGALVTDCADYLKLFCNVNGEKAIGEASVTYLWSVTAAANIRARIPDARIIMILRNPVETAFSLYLENLGNERIHNSFHEQIHADAPWRGQFEPMHPFLEFGIYYEQVKRFLEGFPREKVCILLYEGYRTNQKQSMIDIFRFLGVNPAFEPNTLVRHMRPQIPRSFTIRRLLRRYGISQRLKEWSPNVLVPHLRTLASRRRRSLTMNQEDRQFLVDYYREDIQKLSDLLDRDLSAWIQ